MDNPIDHDTGIHKLLKAVKSSQRGRQGELNMCCLKTGIYSFIICPSVHSIYRTSTALLPPEALVL